LKGRLVSRGGRPADPAPTVRRLVPLRKHVWKELQAQASVLSSLTGNRNLARATVGTLAF
jgi:hypothetical protein